MIPGEVHKRLQWALSLNDWGYRTEAREVLEEVARHVTTEESEVSRNGIETSQTNEEAEHGRTIFGFRV